MARIERRCPTCQGRKLLWLGGGDYVECPDCDGSGVFVLYEQRISPKTIILPAASQPQPLIIPGERNETH